MARLTTHRQAILDLINASNQHWDAESVALALSGQGNAIGIATIYRGLAALEEAGLIESIQLADKKRYERANKAHHDHLICNQCGAIQEFTHETIETLQRCIAAEREFELSGHQLVLFGLCRKCSEG